MAITDGTRFDEEPIGAGLHGHTKYLFSQLAAATEKEIFFGSFKLSDPEHNGVFFLQGTTAGGVVLQGVPDTTILIETDGESIKLEDVAGGAFAYGVVGVWSKK